MPLHIIISINIIEEGKKCEKYASYFQVARIHHYFGGFLNGEEIFRMKFYLFLWALYKNCNFSKIRVFKKIPNTNNPYDKNLKNTFIFVIGTFSKTRALSQKPA